MRRSFLAVSTCLLLTLGLSGCDDEDEDDQESFIATLSGANEVPPSGSTATGTATIERDGDEVDFTVTVNGLTAVTMAHIHSGAAGVNGPIRVNLFLGPTTGTVNGQLVSGTFTATDVQTISFDVLLNELRTGAAYVNVHTTAFPAGEIRGQTALR
jgi:hypothetical protein